MLPRVTCLPGLAPHFPHVGHTTWIDPKKTGGDKVSIVSLASSLIAPGTRCPKGSATIAGSERLVQPHWGLLPRRGSCFLDMVGLSGPWMWLLPLNQKEGWILKTQQATISKMVGWLAGCLNLVS